MDNTAGPITRPDNHLTHTWRAALYESFESAFGAGTDDAHEQFSDLCNSNGIDVFDYLSYYA